MKTRPAFAVILVFCTIVLVYNIRSSRYAYSEEQQSGKKLILQYTPIFGELIKNNLGDCPLKDKCEVVIDKSLFPKASAVVFHDASPVYPDKAFEDQKMVVLTMESAPNVLERWAPIPGNYIDWVMSYLSSSDVKSPYGGYWVDPKTAKERGFIPENLPTDEETIFSNKTIEGALWFVSNCNTPSGREKVFSELGKYFKIDIVGACAKDTNMKEFCPKGSNRDDKKVNYYFLIIAENSVCTDYITEKYWNSYQLPVIPIVLRKKVYENKIPPKSFIAVDDFLDAQSMATYLKDLMKNKTAYMEYFEWRKQGWARAPWNAENYRIGMCDLCDKLWKNQTTNKPPYQNVLHWYTQENNCENDIFAKQWVRRSHEK